MATKLSLYNGAAALLGETPLASLSEDRSLRYWLDRAFDNGVIDFCLEQGKWSFAIRSQKITPSTTIIPAFGFEYAYELPSDFKGLNSIWTDPDFINALEEYDLEAGVIYTNWEDIYIKFVSNAASYGGNLARFTESFAKYVEARLANEVQPNVTNSPAMAQKMAITEANALMAAKNYDKRNKKVDRLPLGMWNRSRSGFFSSQRGTGTGF